MSKSAILAIDNDQLVLLSYKMMFENLGYEVHTCSSGFAGLQLFREHPAKFPVVLLDYDMIDRKTGAGINGDLVAAGIKRANKKTKILMVSGTDNEEVIANCLAAGAEQFIVKTSDSQKIIDTVSIMLSTVDAPIESSGDLEERHTSIKKILKMVGASRELAKVAELISKYSAFDEPVLILGESGVGKEAIAKAVHENSPRKKNQFVAVNCTAIGKDLLESELFGHEKGSFTGAINRKIGLFEHADGGTIFLDEIGDMPIDLQAKLLRTLQEKTVHPVGGVPRKVDFRVVCATHQNLKEAVEEGRFRQDLYYRIKYMTIEVAPLRERPEDIEPLVLHFLNIMNEKTGLTKKISEGALRALKGHAWIGNVRDLEAAVKKAFVISQSVIHVEDFEDQFSQSPLTRFAAIKEQNNLLTYGEFEERVRDLERWVLSRALELANNVKGDAAELLGMSASTFKFKYAQLAKIGTVQNNKLTTLKGGNQ